MQLLFVDEMSQFQRVRRFLNMFLRSWQKKQELFRRNYWQMSQIELNQGKTEICGHVRYIENPNSYEQVVESSLLSYPKKRELAKVAKNVFSRVAFHSHYCSIYPWIHASVHMNFNVI